MSKVPLYHGGTCHISWHDCLLPKISSELARVHITLLVGVPAWIDFACSTCMCTEEKTVSVTDRNHHGGTMFPYRGTSLIRNRHPVGPYRRPGRRVLGGS